MNRFLQALANLFRIEDLRKRVLFTLAMLAVYRIGAHIPTPGINKDVLELYFQQAQNSALGIFDLFSVWFQLRFGRRHDHASGAKNRFPEPAHSEQQQQHPNCHLKNRDRNEA